MLVAQTYTLCRAFSRDQHRSSAEMGATRSNCLFCRRHALLCALTRRSAPFLCLSLIHLLHQKATASWQPLPLCTIYPPPPGPLRSPQHGLGGGVFVTAVNLPEVCRPRGFHKTPEVVVAPESGHRKLYSPFSIAHWILSDKSKLVNANKCHE